MTPRILVTASAGEARREYVEALRDAGAEPVVIAAGAPAHRLLRETHGVLLSGGADVDPAAYGAAGSPFVTHTEPERDVLEFDIVRAARELRMPTLCVCRGLQIANVAFGGTLIADIPHRLTGTVPCIRHEVGGPVQEDGWELVAEHVVDAQPGSALARMSGTTRLVTNAVHHQAVDRCANDLRVVARTADGIVEALEARFASPFWLAVQWHPESTYSVDPASRAIFSAFVDAASVAGETSSASRGFSSPVSG